MAATTERWRSGKWKNFLALSHDAEGWWLNVQALDDDRWGPYDTRAEAVEARRSYLRNALSKPWLEEMKRKSAKAK
jgi:hypothetical protein